MSPHTAFGLGLLTGVSCLTVGFGIRWAMARIAERLLRRTIARRDVMITAALTRTRLDHNEATCAVCQHPAGRGKPHEDLVDRELRLMLAHRPDDALQPACVACATPWPCPTARAIGITA